LIRCWVFGDKLGAKMEEYLKLIENDEADQEVSGNDKGDFV